MVDALSRQVCRAGRWLLPVLLLSMAGCLNDHPDPKRPDPLTGLPKRIPPGERAVSSTYNPADQGRSAMLASSGPQPGEGSSGLGIRDNRASDADRTTQPAGAWTGNQSRNSATPTAGTRPGGAAPDNGAAGLRVRTFEEAQQFLSARGMKWQELKNTGESEWSFACSIPTKNSTSVRTYEARDRYGLLAMQKVIDQILREQQGR